MRSAAKSQEAPRFIFCAGHSVACPAVYVLLVWLAFLAMHGYYFLLDWQKTPHPSCIPLFSFIAVQVVALLFAVVIGVGQLIRGPARLKTAAWLLLAFLPGFFWYSQVSLALQVQAERRTRQVEVNWSNWYLATSQTIAAALFDGIACWTLPHRLEGERAVMFYDDTIADPEGDLKKMDDFIKSEEKFLGASMPAKMHWLRTGIFGFHGLALSSVALTGSNKASDGKIYLQSVDFHEASHNIIGIPTASEFCAGNSPPFLLIEGWAMARSESWGDLVDQCWGLKQRQLALTVREMCSAVYYNQTDNRLYQQGGALVTVLLDKFGPEKFRELYVTCNRKTLERDIERIYGMTLEEWDALYWREIEAYRKTTHSFDKAVEKLSAEEKSLLDEFRTAYDRQMEDFYRVTANGTIKAVMRSSYHGSDEESSGWTEQLFHARQGQFFRDYATSTSTSHSQENGQEEGQKTEQKTERTDCYLLTPHETLNTFQYVRTGEEPRQNAWRFAFPSGEQKYRQQEFQRHRLRNMRPFSLFYTSYGHPFTSPDAYLWDPPVGICIESLTLEGDTAILKLTYKDFDESELTLRMDRKQNWLLLDAHRTYSYKDKQFVQSDFREYGDMVQNMPMLKKRTVTTTGENSGSTEEWELLHFDPTPVDETIFHEKNLPLSVPRPTNSMFSEQRLKWHGVIAACWLVVSLVMIVLPKRHVGNEVTRGSPAV